MNCAVQWTAPSMTELSIDKLKWLPNLSQSQQRGQQSIFSTHLCTLLSVMHLQRIIIENKLAQDFIHTVLLSIYNHVIELVPLAIWWLLAPLTNWCQ